MRTLIVSGAAAAALEDLAAGRTVTYAP